MPRPEDDREAIDRAFAEIVAGYHLTAERPDPLLSGPVATESRSEPRAADSRSADSRIADSRGPDQQGADVLSAEPPPSRPPEQHNPETRKTDPIIARTQETASPQAAPERKIDDLPEQPLFRFVPYVPPAPERATTDQGLPERAAAESTPEQLERFVPPPLEPLPRPDLPSLLGWIGIGYAVLFVLITAVGVRLPGWAGWLAIIGFVGALAVLIARLPRQQPPDDGAVL
jgi:hypothetical protein